ncbi:MAG TPA: ABC transporter ATP-binding protein [Conexibacter sp.]|jgi:branched-chain amino acid transport system ATP-binding protein
MLEITGLKVRYDRVEAVRGIDLKVAAGEVVALLGANGAGKTSTLRAISQLVGSEGEIRFDGQSLRGMTPQETTRLGLVHVPEGRHVFGTLTVHENLQIGESARAGRSGVSIDDVYEMFEPLKALRKRGGWALSGGEQQMVAIGRALLGAPRLLMLDEPSLGLSPAIATAMFEALAQIRHTTPMLVVEQNTALVLGLAEHAYVLASGEVVLHARSSELARGDTLLDAYLGRTRSVGVG